MALEFKKATREKIWVKLALMGASGGGKTYSSLRIATGMRQRLHEMGIDTRIVMLNTENKRGYYYANEFDYDIIDVEAPHNPEKYASLINEIVKDGTHQIVIMDSTSHEWEGKGGCLELHQEAGGTFQSWGRVTPRHNKFLIAIADSPLHIIATMRGKDQYEIEKDKDNKTNVKKLGVGAKQRDGFEYEFTATFLMDQASNTATVQKDNTHLFEDDKTGILFEENHGVAVIDWANSGEGYTPTVRYNEIANEPAAKGVKVNTKASENPVTTEVADELKSVKEENMSMLKALGGSSNTTLLAMVSKYARNGNPNSIKDLDSAKQLNEELKVLVDAGKEKETE